MRRQIKANQREYRNEHVNLRLLATMVTVPTLCFMEP